MIILRSINFGGIFTASGARGFFGEGWWFHRIYRFLFPGRFDVRDYTNVEKTATWHMRAGNMTPKSKWRIVRLFERMFPRCIVVKPFSGAVLNSVGLTNPGAETLFATGIWQKMERPFVLSFMAVGKTLKDRIEETRKYVELLRQELPKFRAKVALEINISCPNTGHDTSDLASIDNALVLLGIASTLDTSIIVKINTLMSDEAIKTIVDSGLCDALTVSNTMPWDNLPAGLRIQYFGTLLSPIEKRNKAFGRGGVSGKPILPFVLKRISEIRALGIKIPIIGGGGILNAKDVLKFKEAGADAVAIGSVLILRPWRVASIVAQAVTLFGRSENG